jgi:hypothetical protein
MGHFIDMTGTSGGKATTEIQMDRRDKHVPEIDVTKISKKGFAMDPITACATVVAAILNYATEVRRTMAPEARDAFDKMVLEDLSFWRRVFGLSK